MVRKLGCVMVLLAMTLPAVAAGKLLARPDPARGIIRVTRHPVMWGIMLWAGAHILARGELKSTIFFGTFLVLAAAGTRLQDARKARTHGEDWKRFAALTSNLPFAAIAEGRNRFAPGEIGLVQLVFAVWMVSQALQEALPGGGQAGSRNALLLSRLGDAPDRRAFCAWASATCWIWTTAAITCSDPRVCSFWARLMLFTISLIDSIDFVICFEPRACSCELRSTCFVMIFIFSALFMICSEPRACSAVADAICWTASAIRLIAIVTCLEPRACSMVARSGSFTNVQLSTSLFCVAMPVPAETSVIRNRSSNVPATSRPPLISVSMRSSGSWKSPCARIFPTAAPAR